METLAIGFTVTPKTGLPTLVSVSPNTGQQDQRNILVAVTGLNTHFAPGTSQGDFGAGITVSSVAVTNATSLTAQITIGASATIGARTVAVTTGSEVVSLDSGFTVL